MPTAMEIVAVAAGRRYVAVRLESNQQQKPPPRIQRGFCGHPRRDWGLPGPCQAITSSPSFTREVKH